MFLHPKQNLTLVGLTRYQSFPKNSIQPTLDLHFHNLKAGKLGNFVHLLNMQSCFCEYGAKTGFWSNNLCSKKKRDFNVQRRTRSTGLGLRWSTCEARDKWAAGPLLMGWGAGATRGGSPPHRRTSAAAGTAAPPPQTMAASSCCPPPGRCSPPPAGGISAADNPKHLRPFWILSPGVPRARTDGGGSQQPP